MKLIGKKALIAGGNGGTSLATARLFIVDGALVATTGRDQKTLDKKYDEGQASTALDLALGESDRFSQAIGACDG